MGRILTDELFKVSVRNCQTINNRDPNFYFRKIEVKKNKYIVSDMFKVSKNECSKSEIINELNSWENKSDDANRFKDYILKEINLNHTIKFAYYEKSNMLYVYERSCSPMEGFVLSQKPIKNENFLVELRYIFSMIVEQEKTDLNTLKWFSLFFYNGLFDNRTIIFTNSKIIGFNDGKEEFIFVIDREKLIEDLKYIRLLNTANFISNRTIILNAIKNIITSISQDTECRFHTRIILPSDLFGNNFLDFLFDVNINPEQLNVYKKYFGKIKPVKKIKEECTDDYRSKYENVYNNKETQIRFDYGRHYSYI